MKQFFLFGFCTVSFFLIAAPLCFSQDDVSSSLTVTGKVYDRATERPLQGALINITNTETRKKISNVLTTSDGSYSFSMSSVSSIKLDVSHDGYKGQTKSFTRDELIRNKYRLPAFYLDTTIKIVIPPPTTHRESKQEFVSNNLIRLRFVPTKAAYDLLDYLNPDLKSRDSLMSDDHIRLPKMPEISISVKKNNKKQFQEARSKDHATQNMLRDSIDKLIRILGDDISRYKIKYSGVDPEKLRQMRDYMRMDLQDYKQSVSKTSRLKSQEMMSLINQLGLAQERIVAQRSIQASDFESLKLLWEDLSYMLLTKRYTLFTATSTTEESEIAVEENKEDKPHSGPLAGNEFAPAVVSHAINNEKIKTKFAANEDEVGVFGFIIWSPEITSNTNPDLAQPGGRYVVRYFFPAFSKDQKMYKTCTGNANVAIANLTRARYGVEVYDTEQKKVVPLLYPTFTTEEAFTNKKYDALLISDFREVKYVLLRLQ